MIFLVIFLSPDINFSFLIFSLLAGIALDIASKHVYFGDASLDKIERCGKFSILLEISVILFNLPNLFTNFN